MIADQIPAGSCLADVGTDHAYLPVYLLQTGKIQKAIASDIRLGPLESAQRTADKYKIHNNLSLRLSNGLEKIEESECNVVVIAGMGGENIRDILKAAPWTQKGNHILFLQPMSMSQELRYWLLNHGYAIENEFVCQEEKHLYNLMQCKGAEETEKFISFAACAASPALRKAKNGCTYLKKQAKRQEKILSGLRKSAKADPEQLKKAEETMKYLQIYLQEGEK
jgi:tRNA (adenine22-N1)-methyltransferase